MTNRLRAGWRAFAIAFSNSFLARLLFIVAVAYAMGATGQPWLLVLYALVPLADSEEHAANREALQRSYDEGVDALREQIQDWELQVRERFALADHARERYEQACVEYTAQQMAELRRANLRESNELLHRLTN